VEDLESYADEGLYADEEEEVTGEEKSNRTFIILVGVLGGLLALAICVFVVWAFVLYPRMAADRAAENYAIEGTNEAIMAAVGTVTATISSADTAVPVQADTPEPVRTKPPTATAVPATATAMPATATSEVAEAATTATPGEVAEAASTATPNPTPTRRVTATPRPKEGVPETGIGALAAGALALGLMFLLIVVRRMRQAI
jgi:cytoskeletal protein RodZ